MPQGDDKDWQKIVRDAMRRENWSLSDNRQPVKAVPLADPVVTHVGGYFTVACAMAGKTPRQIENMLGLKPGCFAQGCRIYRMARLPTQSEYEYQLTAFYPDGLCYIEWLSNPDYPPGDRTVHQWQLRRGVAIPVEAASRLDLRPDTKVPSNQYW